MEDLQIVHTDEHVTASIHLEIDGPCEGGTEVYR